MQFVDGIVVFINQSYEITPDLARRKTVTGDRAKYLGLIFTIAFWTFLLENQTSIFAGILKPTGSQIADVTDANICVMDPKTEYFEQTKALKALRGRTS